MNAWPTLKQWLEFGGTVSLELLILFATAKLISLRLHSAQLRRCLWQVVMVATLLVVGGELSGVREIIRLPSPLPSKEKAAPQTRAVVVTIKEVELPMASAPILPFEPLAHETVESTQPISPWQKRTSWPVLIWSGLTVLLLGRIFLGQMLSLSFRASARRSVDADLKSRIVRLAELLRIRRRVTIVNNAKATAPFTFGVWRPVIVLPARFTEIFTPEQQDAALAHELAHVAGVDSAWRALSNFTCALLWWNPFAWLAKRELDHASELVADESSLLLSDGPDRLAECLVACANQIQRPTTAAWLGMDGGGFRSSLGKRVSRLLQLNPRANAAVRVPWYVRIILPMICALALWFAMEFVTGKSAAPSQNPWRDSLIGSALAALAEPAKGDLSEANRVEVTRLIQDGKLYYETGRLDEAEESFAAALKLDAHSKGARYYLDLVNARKAAVRMSLREVEQQGTEPMKSTAQFADTALHTRFFKVDPNTFWKELQSLVSFDPKTGETNRIIESLRLKNSGRMEITNSESTIEFLREAASNQSVIPAMRSFLELAGVDLSVPGKAIFYKDRIGMLMVRATLQDMDTVEKAVQLLNTRLPQLEIRVKVMEVPVESSQRTLGQFGITNAPRSAGAPVDSLLSVASGFQSTNRPSPTVTGILTDEQFRKLIAEMEKTGGTDLLSAPAVTTMSGRQAQIKVVDIRYIVTDIDYSTNGLPAGSPPEPRPIAEPFEIGPVVDVVPYVEADGYTIQMTVLPTLREFLGYDDDPLHRRNDLPATGGPLAPAPRQATPLPQFRLRQVASTARVWDGQTLVLGAGRARTMQNTRDANGTVITNYLDKALFFFITPRLIDQAGNPLHGDAELWQRTGVPEQKRSANE